MTTSTRTRIASETASRLVETLEALQQQQPKQHSTLSRAEFVRQHAKTIRQLIVRGFSLGEIGEALRAVEPTLSDTVIKANLRSPRRTVARSHVSSATETAAAGGGSPAQ